MKIEDIIVNDDQNQICLDEISKLMDGDPEVNSREGVLLNVLATVVEAYEKKRWPIGDDEERKIPTVRLEDFTRRVEKIKE